MLLVGCEKPTGQFNQADEAKLNVKVDKILSEAKPIGDKSASEVMREKMIIDSTKSMNEQNSDHKKSLNAAANFFGFYFINTRNRFDYCQALGVNLQGFVDAFKTENQKEFIEASNIFSTSTTPNVESLYTVIKPSLEKTIKFTMTDQAKQAGLSQVDFCHAIENNSADFASRMRYASAVPEMAAQLAKPTR
jgi:hypothetical protein